MRVRSVTEKDEVVLVAPCDGVVRFLAPAALTGELEVFGAGSGVAVVGNSGGDVTVTAPVDGFVVRQMVPDGGEVERWMPLLALRAV
jgi:hypothetical protein